MPQNDKDGINGIMKQKAKKDYQGKKTKKIKKNDLSKKKRGRHRF